MAIVGSATVAIRAITNKIEADIIRGLRGATPAAEKQGDILGKKFGAAFEKGLKDHIKGIDLSSTVKNMARQGQDAGRSFGDSFEAGFKKRMSEMGVGDAMRGMRQQGEQQGNLFGQSFAKGFRNQARNIDMTGLGSGNQRAAGEDAGKKFGDSFGVGFRNSIKDMNTNTLRARFRSDAFTLGQLFGGEFNRGFKKSQKDIDTSVLQNRVAEAGRIGGRGAVEEINGALSRLRAGGTAGRKQGNDFVKNFKGAFGGIPGSPLAEMATTASLAGNAMAVAAAAVASLGASLVSVAGAGALAAGSLVVIPGIIGAIIQGAGTLAVAFKGVGEAISAGRAAETAKVDATAVQAAARAVVAAQRSIRDALQGVQQAQTAAARSARDYRERISEAVAHVAEVAAKGAADIVDANNDVVRAQRDVTRAVEDAARAREDAADRVSSAEDRLTRAQRAERDAQLALTQARIAAQEQLQQLGFSLEDAVLSEDRAAISLEKAQERLAEVQDLPPDNRMRREAELAFKEAELNLRQAKDRTADLKVEADAAAAAGVDGSEVVLDAQQRQADAAQDVIDATEDLTDAHVDGARAVADADQAAADATAALVQAQTDAANAVIEATNNNAEAERDLRILRRDAAEEAIDQAARVRDAQERLGDAQAGLRDAQLRLNDAQGAGTTEATKYQDALDNLSPQAAAFVKQIVGMKDEFTRLRNAAGVEFFPLLGAAVQQVVDSGFLDTLRKVLRDTGETLGIISGKIAEFISSDFFQGAFATIADGNNRLLEHMADAGLLLADAFVRIMVAAQPLIDRFGTWLEDVAGRIDEFFKAASKGGEDSQLVTFFERAGDAAATFGGLFKEIGGLFTDILSASADSGLGLIESLTASIEDLRTSLEDVDLAGYFEKAADNTRAVFRLIAGVAAIFVKLGDNTSIKETADLLTEKLLPNIERIVNAVADEGGPALAELAIAISDVLVVLAESGSMNSFVNALTDIVKIGGQVVSFLSDTGILGPLLLLAGSLKAVSVAAKVVGFAFGPFFKLLFTFGKFLINIVKYMRIFAAMVQFIGVALGIPLGPILLIIGAIALLIGAFVLAYKKSETFRNAINAIGQALLDFVTGIWDNVIHPIVDAFVWLYDQLLGHSVIWDIVDGAIAAFHFLVDPIIKIFDTITDAIMTAVNWVLDFLRDNWPLILAILTGPIGLAVLAITKNWDKIKGFFSAAWDFIQNVFALAWEGVKEIVIKPIRDAKDKLVAVFKYLFGSDSFFQQAVDWVVDIFKKAWDGIKTIITDPVQAAKNIFQNILGEGGTLRMLFSGFVTFAETAWAGLKKAVGTPVNFVIDTVYNNGLRKFWNAIAGKVGLPDLPEIPKIEFARGGVVPGYRPGKDTVPAMLSPGEGILRPEVVRALGKDTILRWNRQAMGGRFAGPPPEFGGRRHYFQGGVVAARRGGFDWPWDEFKQALKTLDPRNVADGLSHVKDVVVGALADSLRVLILKPLRAASNEFASDHPQFGAFAKMPVGALTTVAAKMITFLEGKDKAGIKKEMAVGGILGSAGTGRWQFPLPQGTYSWGVPYGGYPGHTGQDLPAPRGTQIVSVGAGRVATSTDIRGQSRYNNLGYTSYGRYVKIEHAGNIFSLYAHMLERIAKQGQIVAKGQIIGRVDSTGNSSGDHLHFEIRPNDIPSPSVGAFLRGADATGASEREHTAQGGRAAQVSANVAARIAARRYGWSGDEFEALKALTGGDFTTFALRSGQVAGGLEASLEYIKRRYGTPTKALAASLGKQGRSYHSGGWVKGIGDKAALVQGGEYVFSRDQAARLRNGAQVMPGPNGDLRVVAEAGAGGTTVLSRSTDAETLTTLKRLVTALENGEAIGKIDVHPAPGMDERELANKIGRDITWRMTPR